MKIEEFVLGNGIISAVVNKKDCPSFTVLVLVKAGSRYETTKNNGVAHFFEHMVFKGSKKYPSEQKLAFSIERIGGEVNAYTAKDHTGYYIRASREHIESVLDVLSDAFFNPLLREDDIEKEKGVVCEEIQMYNDIPQSRVSKEFYKLAFSSSLRMPITGDIDTVKNLNRDSIFEYLNNLYTADRIVLVFVGDFSKINMKALAEEYFSRKIKKSSRQDFDKEESFVSEKKQLVLNEKVNQAHFIIGFKTFSFFDKRKYALQIAASILGSGMGSLLFQELRGKRGWAYYLFSDVHFYEDAGAFIIKAGVVDRPDIIRSSVDLSVRLLERLKKKISTPDFERAKEYWKGSFALSLENNFNLAQFVGNRLLFYRKVSSPNDIVKKIDKVKKIEVGEVLTDIFSQDKMAGVVITGSDINNLF